MEKVEFRLAPDGVLYYKEHGKDERRVTRFSHEIIDPLADVIEKMYPECHARLATLYRKGSGKASKGDMVERFIRCNFGEHDLLTEDIDHGALNFEEVRCPLRGGFCPHEGIICKPKSVRQLSPAEREVVDLYIMGYTFKEIAERLGKCASTVKAQLFNIKKRFALKSCREIIREFRTKQY